MLGYIVLCRTEPARDYDYIVIRQRVVESLADFGGIVAYRGAFADGDSRIVQSLRDVLRIGVENLTYENLVADGYDFGFHTVASEDCSDSLVSSCWISERQMSPTKRGPL